MTVTDVRIKKMKTRWGSCNAEARRIWLNLELAKKPASCLAYILVHEMVHFLETGSQRPVPGADGPVHAAVAFAQRRAKSCATRARGVALLIPNATA